MASRSLLTSTSVSLLNQQHKNRRTKTLPTIYCVKGNSETDDESELRKNRLNLLKLSVTLTIVSASLPQPSLAAKASSKKRSVKKSEGLTLQEVRAWSEGLPVVSNRLGYTELLDLKRQGKLKHIVTPPNLGIKLRPEVVLAVLEDSRVVRIVLPSLQSDSKFWEQWDKLNIGGLCVNAYTPPLKTPELPTPFLGVLTKFPVWITSIAQRLTRLKPQAKKALDVRKAVKEMARKTEEELQRKAQQIKMQEMAIQMQREMEEKKRRAEIRKATLQESLSQVRESPDDLLWVQMASNQSVSTTLGLVFFVIFYRTVVLSYKKQKKDYEERLNMEKMEDTEKATKELFQLYSDDDFGEEGRKGENNAYMKMASQFMESGARVKRARDKKIPQYMERDVDVKFEDVAGLGDIRLELEEIVKFFTEAEVYRRRGVKIPGGILLCGPPGVGKTLLAKAVAGEAGVNFFSISASQFVEIYVGVGASRVRALYQEAKENAPAVVFIDELDAVGRKRGLIKGSGGQERDATLNQLLVCLDGFEGRGEVITIASTNRSDILDPALVRPGRFDRKIFIPRPGLEGRVEILKVHARKKPMAPDVDYLTVASVTDGMVGAELANIVEVAAINMMRDGRTQITTDDLLQGAQMEEQGMLDKKERSAEMWKQIAVNEAAAAVVAVNLPNTGTLDFINIAPRAGREVGYVRMTDDLLPSGMGLMSRQYFLDNITIQLAARAADELWYGKDQLSTIWAEAANNARSDARSFVLRGLSGKYYGLSKFWVADRINEIDLETQRIMNTCYERAKEILHRNRNLMDAVVDELIQKKSMTKQEFYRLVELHGTPPPEPLSLFDMRSARRTEFQDIVMTQ